MCCTHFDPTHGQQQFTFFNRHYDSYCYLPMVCFFTFNEETEQYLVAAVLRRGNATGSLGALIFLCCAELDSAQFCKFISCVSRRRE
jgi:Transposase DDE domain group 1